MPFYSKSDSIFNTGFLKSFGLAFCWLVLLPFLTFAQITFKKGVVIDSVEVLNTTGESFALYLPKSFDTTKPSSIIFVFEPAARGAVGVAPFTEAAETYGHIIVCSNNSKNGPYEKSFQFANTLFDHVFSTFTINESEMYVAGFSGGARLASAIAVLTDRFVGVIACGAGLSADPSHIPSVQSFAYVGICGNEDMNYREMLNNKGFLEKTGLKNTLITYNGEHRWPPKDQINKAFRWLSIATDTHKESWVTNFNAEYQEADLLKANNEQLLAAENYDRLLRFYSSHFSLDTVKTSYLTLTGSKPYKTEVKALQMALAKEDEWSKRLFDRFNKDIQSPKSVNMSWWRKEFEKLKKLEEKGAKQQKKMIKRLRFSLFAAAYSRGNPNLYSSNNGQLEFCKKIRNLIYL